MNTWIQVYCSLNKHPKTTKLADLLKLPGASVNPNMTAVGMVVSLWSWAAETAVSGDLSGCTDRAIAEACGWKKNPSALVDALKESGFLDGDGKLHDWDEYTWLLMEQEEQRRERTRERVRKHRAKNKAGCNADVTDGNADVTPCNAPTVPNLTIPNLTEPITGDNNIPICLSDARVKRKPTDEEYASLLTLFREKTGNLVAMHMDEFKAFRNERGFL